MRRLGHGVEHRLSQEGERPLAADKQPPEDLQRRVGVEESAEPVAGGVLDLELAPHPLAQLRVRAQLVADLLQATRQLGLGRGEGLLRPGGAGVDRGARRQHERELTDRRVGVGRGPAAHAAGVVGDHAADGGDVGAGGIGAELAAVRGEHPVGVAEQRAGLHPGPGATVLDADAVEVAPDVDEDPGALPLSVQARPPASQRHGDPDSAPIAEDRGYLGCITGPDHRLREHAVGACVRGIADQVDSAAEDAVGAQQLDQLGAQRLGGALGELVRRPVRRGLTVRSYGLNGRGESRPHTRSAHG